jgi:glycosyltransferase involved in cell wall biosynthesis
MNSILFFIDNKLGGVSSLNYNLMRFPPVDTNISVIHITEENSTMSKSNLIFPVQFQQDFVFDRKDNVFHVIKKLRKLIPNDNGVLVLNYGTEMTMLDHFQVTQATVQLVHDAYNVRLAEKYEHVVDAFICHNRHIEAELKTKLPNRREDVFYIPHGVCIPDVERKERRDEQPLKLLFLGRITKAKGVFDLPVIANLLRDKGVEVEWTCIGNGPEMEAFKSSWDNRDKVKFLAPKSNDEVMAHCLESDVFVLPTKFEGTPVSLLETMSTGLVPVITHLPGGIDEIVTDEIGFKIAMDNNKGFADAIAHLNFNRNEWSEKSIRCKEKIKKDFNLEQTSKQYFDVMLKFQNIIKIKTLKKIKTGSRLDLSWMPNILTRLLRSF